MTIRYRTNLVCGIAAVLFAVLLVLMIPGQIALEATASFGVTSRTIPYGVAILIGVCGVSLIVKSLVFGKDQTKEVVLRHELPVLIMLAAIVVYLFIFEKEWPVAASLIGCASLALAKCKKWWYYLIVIALAVALYFLFTEVLYIRLHSVIFGS